MHKTIPLFLLFGLLVSFCYSQARNWTIMHYAVGSNSSEVDLMNDIGEMMRGKVSNDYEVIVLIDRTPGFSDDSATLGENFIDTRLYRITHNNYEELDGGDLFPEIKRNTSFDANMADGHTLKKFIQYAKQNYPAKHYMLVMRSHGNGIGMCPDPEGGEPDRIYPGEMSDVLTNDESVDILGLDVCSMAGLENLYEWRPYTGNFSADYVIASAPLSAAWAYDRIFERLQVNGSENNTDSRYFNSGFEKNFDPNTSSPLDLSTMIMEEIYDNQPWASWGLFDNLKIEALKKSVDELSVKLVSENNAAVLRIIQESLGYHHNTSDDLEIAQLNFPYIDAYDFFSRISNHGSFGERTLELANSVCESLDDLVLYSYYGRGFLSETDRFIEGKSGAYLILPNGKRIFSQTNSSFWSHTNWFHPEDMQSIGNAYGNYDWCINGAIQENGKVENFFEYLDFLFERAGEDVNGYKW